MSFTTRVFQVLVALPVHARSLKAKTLEAAAGGGKNKQKKSAVYTAPDICYYNLCNHPSVL